MCERWSRARPPSSNTPTGRRQADVRSPLGLVRLRTHGAHRRAARRAARAPRRPLALDERGGRHQVDHHGHGEGPERARRGPDARGGGRVHGEVLHAELHHDPSVGQPAQRRRLRRDDLHGRRESEPARARRHHRRQDLRRRQRCDAQFGAIPAQFSDAASVPLQPPWPRTRRTRSSRTRARRTTTSPSSPASSRRAPTAGR